MVDQRKLENELVQAAVFKAPGNPLELQDFRRPIPTAHEAVVRIRCCTLCGSDLHTIAGKRAEAVPSILGHEAVGVVEQVGDPGAVAADGTPLSPGDRVTWSVCISCGSCDRCRGRLPQKCRQLAKYGHEKAEGRVALSGGMAQYILLRQGSTIVRLAESIPDHVVCPANCATATVAAIYRTIGGAAGKRVLILGAGLLGLTASAMAKVDQAASITVCDGQESRLQLAGEFGADSTLACHVSRDSPEQFSDLGMDPSYDIVLELSGSPDAVEAAIDLGDVGAQIVLAGTVMDSRSIHLDPQRVVRRALQIHGVHNYAPQDLEVAVRFLQQAYNQFPFQDVVTAAYSLQDVNKAIESANNGRSIRVAIHP